MYTPRPTDWLAGRPAHTVPFEVCIPSSQEARPDLMKRLSFQFFSFSFFLLSLSSLSLESRLDGHRVFFTWPLLESHSLLSFLSFLLSNDNNTSGRWKERDIKDTLHPSRPIIPLVVSLQPCFCVDSCTYEFLPYHTIYSNRLLGEDFSLSFPLAGWTLVSSVYRVAAVSYLIDDDTIVW